MIILKDKHIPQFPWIQNNNRFLLVTWSKLTLFQCRALGEHTSALIFWYPKMISYYRRINIEKWKTSIIYNYIIWFLYMSMFVCLWVAEWESQFLTECDQIWHGVQSSQGVGQKPIVHAWSHFSGRDRDHSTNVAVSSIIRYWNIGFDGLGKSVDAIMTYIFCIMDTKYRYCVSYHSYQTLILCIINDAKNLYWQTK